MIEPLAASTVHPGLRDAPRAHPVLLGAGVLAFAGLVALAAGVVETPDLKSALTEVSESLGTWTYLMVAALAFLETGAFVGLVAPGETAVVIGGIVAAQGSVELALMLPLAWAAAAAGDLTSFLLGRRFGRRLLLRRGPALGVTPARMARVERFFERHGAKAILIGRFIGIVRAIAPFLAGSSGMRLRAFLPWSVLGTGVWATTFTLIGYAFGEYVGTAVDVLTYGALALLTVAAAGAWARHRHRARHADHSARS